MRNINEIIQDVLDKNNTVPTMDEFIADLKDGDLDRWNAASQEFKDLFYKKLSLHMKIHRMNNEAI